MWATRFCFFVERIFSVMSCTCPALMRETHYNNPKICNYFKGMKTKENGVSYGPTPNPPNPPNPPRAF